MKIFSFDAETDGLWGNPFAVAAIVYQVEEPENYGDALYKAAKQGAGGAFSEYYPDEMSYYKRFPKKIIEVSRFIARLSDASVTNTWVVENVLPTLATVAPTHETYETMLSDFADFYKANKTDADCICHMGYIVESHLLREMHRLGFIGDWDAPYPLYDVSGNLQAAGEDATSVDGYAKKHALEISDFGTTHNPLYDCEVAAKVYMHLQSVSV